MDYEKLHKDTINKLQQMVSSGKITVETACGICADFVPESDDEKIRKELIKSFNEYLKQSERAWGEDVTFKYVNVKDAIAWLEKQGSQKSVDKDEPKFHEGEWVVYNNDICQIVKREEGCNKLVTIFGIEKELVNERNLSTARLWTIQDAKDGDVLATDDGICIFNGTLEEDKYPIAYCGITKRGFDSYNVNLPFSNDNNIHPATKEQYDALMKAMSDAGYTFDFEKKELKKIEQKSAWSEEDEKKIDSIIETIRIKKYEHPGLSPIYDGDIDWLKSLKDRYTWKPSEEQLKSLQEVIDVGHYTSYPNALETLYEQLKQL